MTALPDLTPTVLTPFRPRVLLLAVIVLSAGCTGLLTGSGDGLSFSAAPITVSDSAVEASGFTVVSQESFSFERSIEAAGQSRSVGLNAHMVNLQRDVGAATPARVVVVSAPNIEVLGQQISIAERVGPMTLVDQAGASTGNLERGQKLREHQLSILGSSRTVEVFSGSAVEDGQEAKVLVFSGTFSHEGDSVVVFGVTPQSASDSEDNVLTAIEGIERP
ncbi:MAG: DUF6517 family protein [Halobacteriales archaeon]|nr:DUF6517 family protein [Halobacteriales archaeon]